MSNDPEYDRLCTVCGGPFNLDIEGGIAGDFGILPVAFCPTCLSCFHDMAEQLWPCERCMYGDEDEDEEDETTEQPPPAQE